MLRVEGYDTKLYMKVRFLFWISVECRERFHCNDSHFHSDPERGYFLEFYMRGNCIYLKIIHIRFGRV